MYFEVEFFPVGNGEQSGDAILVRYWDGEFWRVMLVDGGFAETGEMICEHVRKYYETDFIDYVVSTHPDNDHICGLKVVFEKMSVGEFWVHLPWLHAADILHLFKSRRWQLQNLEAQLYDAHSQVAELVALAHGQGAIVSAPFQGARIGDFEVLSPTVAMYNGLLPQFRATPPPDIDLLMQLGHWITGVGRRVARQVRRVVTENWAAETLREGGTTAAENESSVVLYADFGAGGILLTADAGLRALNVAVDQANRRGFGLQDSLWLSQIPHHGSRNNVSPSILNRIVGAPLTFGGVRRTICVVSAGKDDTTHPRQVVVNALQRRGLKPKATRGQVIRFEEGIGDRVGWVPLVPLAFDPNVEAYE